MPDLLNEFLNQCATESVNAHVAPEPEPVPRYTMAQHKARVAVWQHLVYRGHVVVSFSLLCEAMDEAEARAHKSALGSVR